MRFPVMSENT